MRSGLRRSAAQALAAQLQLARRQPEQEAALLANLATWALQFTPTVCLVPPAGLLLEIEGCLQYFQGLERLRSLISAGLAEMDLAVRLGLAPTPLAASWFALTADEAVPPSTDNWQRRLQQLPLAALPWPTAWQDSLRELGLRRLGELLQLPHAELALRFGSDFTQMLDQACGQQPDPRRPFVPPEYFARRLELNWHIEQVEALGFIARRLLQELAAFLLGRGLGVQQLRWQLGHEGGQRSELLVGLGQPTRAAEAMLAITRERLARFTLPAAVHSVVLIADSLHRLDGEVLGLFGQGQAQADFQLLRARLAARLGEDAVRELYCVADHRPEHAWSSRPPAPSAPALRSERPGWLLPMPLALETRAERPWYGEPLTLLGRAERIESGWWDGASVARDYWQAEGPSGRRYWLYQQRLDGAWFLHGLFA